MRRFHEKVFDVYFDDLDMLGILHNARYILFMERCIGEFWKRLGWRDFSTANPDQFHVVRENHIEYLSPYKGIGELRVRVWVEKLGTTSLVFGFHMMPMDEDRVLATGRRVIVSVDPESRQKAPWTESFRGMLRPYLA